MKNNDYKFKDIADITPEMDEDQQRRAARRGSIAVIIILLALVTAVTFVMYFVEINFGKTAGTIALIVLAVIIAVYLYRKEIMEKFKRNKGEK